jgi:hypothetical protein
LVAENTGAALGVRRPDPTSPLRGCIDLEQEMAHVWYVTFEAHKRGTLPRRRSPRITRTFETEGEAKDFARARLNEGLVVFAGTLNPYLPKQLIPSSRIALWLERSQEGETPPPERDERKDK